MTELIWFPDFTTIKIKYPAPAVSTAFFQYYLRDTGDEDREYTVKSAVVGQGLNSAQLLWGTKDELSIADVGQWSDFAGLTLNTSQKVYVEYQVRGWFPLEADSTVDITVYSNEVVIMIIPAVTLDPLAQEHLFIGNPGYGTVAWHEITMAGNATNWGQIPNSLIKSLPALQMEHYTYNMGDMTLPSLTGDGTMRWSYTDAVIPLIICNGTDGWNWAEAALPMVTLAGTGVDHGTVIELKFDIEAVSYLQGNPSDIPDNAKGLFILDEHPTVTDLAETIFWGM